MTDELELVWVQNLKGFVRGVFPANDEWKEVFQRQLDNVNKTDKYNKRCAVLIEAVRDAIGMGYSETDIEDMQRIMLARNKEWEKLERENTKLKQDNDMLINALNTLAECSKLLLPENQR